jgi:hypothetical protein
VQKYWTYNDISCNEARIFLKGVHRGRSCKKEIQGAQEHAPKEQFEAKEEQPLDLPTVQAAEAPSQGVHQLRFLQRP